MEIQKNICKMPIKNKKIYKMKKERQNMKNFFKRTGKKGLQKQGISYIMNHVVTLIAMKREVAAPMRGFSVERMSS